MREAKLATRQTAALWWTPAWSALIALGLFLTLSACSSVSDTSASWMIRFACGEEGRRAQQVVISIAEGECPASNTVLYSATIDRSGDSSAEPPPSLKSGIYAFDARAFDANGSVVAQTCRAVRFPSSGAVVLLLGDEASCPDSGPPSDWIDAGAPPPSGTDGGPSPTTGGAPDPKNGPRIEVSPAEVVAGGQIVVAYFDVPKPGMPFIGVFLASAKDPTQTFKIPFKKTEMKVSGKHSFTLAAAGSYLVKLVSDGGALSEGKVEVLADRDGDKVPDRDDGCADDPLKRAPEMCGCGVSETDTDGDHVADCNDQCDDDPLKSLPGTCGCGFADSTADPDNDGVTDCYDGCPADSNKTAPMRCGCGVAETDSDGDMTVDCLDQCPSDPTKSTKGSCGCGVPEGCVLCAFAKESESVSLSCASGSTIQTISFASFGTPSGSCPGGFSLGTCDAPSSLATVQAACVGKQSCTVLASNAIFTDPCAGTPKMLATTYTCSN